MSSITLPSFVVHIFLFSLCCSFFTFFLVVLIFPFFSVVHFSILCCCSSLFFFPFLFLFICQHAHPKCLSLSSLIKCSICSPLIAHRPHLDHPTARVGSRTLKNKSREFRPSSDRSARRFPFNIIFPFFLVVHFSIFLRCSSVFPFFFFVHLCVFPFFFVVHLFFSIFLRCSSVFLFFSVVHLFFFFSVVHMFSLYFFFFMFSFLLFFSKKIFFYFILETRQTWWRNVAESACPCCLV